MARDVMLARHTGSRVHVAHVSTAGTVEVIRWAKAQGIAVTAEVTPHHLVLTTDLLAGYDPTFKVNPPLRPQEDVDALRAALADGTIDAVATDHAPHARHDKEHAFIDAAFGMLGLETALSVVSDVMVGSGLLDWAGVARVMSVAPARIAGLASHGQPLAVGVARPPDPGRPGSHGHGRPQRLAVAVPQQPLARPHPARRRPRHGLRRPRDRPEGSHRVTRLQAVGVMLVALGPHLRAAVCRVAAQAPPARVRGHRRRAQPDDPRPRPGGAGPEGEACAGHRRGHLRQHHHRREPARAGHRRRAGQPRQGDPDRQPWRRRRAGADRPPGRGDRRHPGGPADLGAPRARHGRQVRRGQPARRAAVAGRERRRLRDRLPAALQGRRRPGRVGPVVAHRGDRGAADSTDDDDRPRPDSDQTDTTGKPTS